jgi:hypothetical protein
MWDVIEAGLYQGGLYSTIPPLALARASQALLPICQSSCCACPATSEKQSTPASTSHFHRRPTQNKCPIRQKALHTFTPAEFLEAHLFGLVDCRGTFIKLLLL